MKEYFIDYKTGKISKELPKGMGFSSDLITWGYRAAQAVARLIKKGDTLGALRAANNGIESRLVK